MLNASLLSWMSEHEGVKVYRWPEVAVYSVCCKSIDAFPVFVLHVCGISMHLFSS